MLVFTVKYADNTDGERGSEDSVLNADVLSSCKVHSSYAVLHILILRLQLSEY